ncbi:MAG: hypothetical protein CL827_09580 [Crocinitomicaceae bacterium]|nr:hypothetical protein [Crocinitomicaceae bacterium]
MNELTHANSAYLRHHAKNPIHWKFWSDAILELAVKENKLIILSIGYSACHWCHVMEKETFRNELIANFMNQNFICIKIDREEHPDVDHIYMDFILNTKGNGGWPLNCILLPDTRPVFAGTYYKADDWLNLISRFYTFFKETPDKLIAYSKNYIEHLNEEEKFIESSSFKHSSCFNEWESFLDLDYGGIKSRQKFPMPNFLVYMIYLPKTKKWDVFLDLTLKNITQKGIYDPLDGGFFRYCIDEKWNIPHFEKMLYDNAQLISVLSNFDLINKKRKYILIVDQTIHFWLSIKSKNAFFPSSIDADNEDGEGGYYWFKKDEISKILSKKELEYAAKKYNMNDPNLQQNKWHIHNDPHINIEQEETVATKLKKIRSNKSFPEIDQKAICSWNCMMVTGLIDAGIAYKNIQWLKLAEETLQLIFDHFTIKNQCNRLVYNKKMINGTLEDYSWLIAAAISISSIKNSVYWLSKSLDWMEIAIEKFWNKKKGLFTYSVNKSLYKQTFEVEDQVIPSSNSLMANNLHELFQITRQENYLDKMNTMIMRVANKANKWLPNFTNWMLLKQKLNSKKIQYLVMGLKMNEILALHHQKNNLASIYILEKGSDILIFKEKYKEKVKNIFICNENSCISEIDNVKDALRVKI